jgi:hypothetical protein
MENDEFPFNEEDLMEALKSFIGGFNDLAKLFGTSLDHKEFSPTRTVSCAEVYDRKWRYEVAVRHENYNEGEWIVVASSNEKADIEKKFQMWCEKFENEDFDDGFFDIYLWTLFLEDKNGQN